MRAPVCAIVVAIGLFAHPAFAETDKPAQATFWKTVQANCSATAAKPPSELGQRIAHNAIEEFTRFGGHRLDSNGRLFHFGLTEAEHDADDGGGRPATLDHVGWWEVMKYWRSLFGDEAPDKLEVRGYKEASVSKDDKHTPEALSTSAGDLMRAAEAVTDPELREVLREAALRTAVIDTPWSAAFISYVVKEAGVPAGAFQFSNAHRAYIYDAFATSAAEINNQAGDRIYRACPLGTTKPRPGDLICFQREPSLADASDEEVRERIRSELESGGDTRSIRRTHCDVVAYIDAPARKAYSIGGNILQSITARKLNLHSRGLKLSAEQKSNCGGAGSWTMPQASGAPGAPGNENPNEKCSLNDKKWFVLLQLR